MIDLFDAAQKPWTKILKEIQNTKRKYHRACDDAKVLMNRINNALAENPKLRSTQVSLRIFRFELLEFHRFSFFRSGKDFKKYFIFSRLQHFSS